MSKKNVDDLRDVLFDTMKDVRAGKIDVQTARVIAELGQTVINSAKAEIDFLKAGGDNRKIGFIESNEELKKLPDGTTVRQHRTR